MPPEVPEFLKPLLASPVAIFGGGVSGQAVYMLLEKLGAKGVIFDRKTGGNGIVSNFGPTEAKRHHLVVYSPGFAPDHVWLGTARAAGCECLGEMDFASLFWRGSLVAITGTNGKTTLTELLTHALRSVGRDAFATGNIGFPLTALAAGVENRMRDAKHQPVAVCEVSSFQAETLGHLRAEAVLWTNFAEDHLERHESMAAYFAAKWNLVTRAKEGAVFAGASVQRHAEALGKTLPDRSRVFSEVKTGDLRLDGTIFASQPQLENFLLAAAWWRHEGLPEGALLAAARSFRPGRHRLARVFEGEGVTWWNDSKATNFHAVESALGSFSTPVFLIAGGKAKGGDIPGFVRRIAPRVRHAYLIGETSALLARACGLCGLSHTECSDLGEAVRLAAAAGRPGDQILLSPGFASFDQFRNYEDRGDQFENLVNNLGVTPTLR